MPTPRRIAVYTRVSTGEQTTENQLLDLQTVAQQRGWMVVGVYEDAGISGAKGRSQRPALDRLLRDAVRGRFDLVAVWSVDRLGRSLQDLVGTLAELQAARVDLYLHRQALDTGTPSGRAMFGMLGVFAEFERSMIQERVKAGLVRARAQGKRLGRPRVEIDRAELERARVQRLSVRQAAALLGTSVSTAHRLLQRG